MLEVTGHFAGRVFSSLDSPGEVSRVGRDWPGIRRAVLGPERHVLGLEAGTAVHVRAGTLGAVVAHDLILAQE